MTLYMHPVTKKFLEIAKNERPHALLLSGEKGVGLQTAASLLGNTHHTIYPEKNGAVDRAEGAISVEMIRQLYSDVRTIATEQRIIVIVDAERMTIQAQNAFLKLLEEPTTHTQFVLLSHAPEQLLSTIRSRVQHIIVKRMSAAESQKLLDELEVKDKTTRQQLLFIAQGRPSLLHAYAKDEALLQARIEIMKDAKTFAGDTKYEQLRIAHKYASARTRAVQLLEDAVRIVRNSLAQNHRHETTQLQKKLASYHMALERLSRNAHVKLSLLAAVVGDREV